MTTHRPIPGKAPGSIMTRDSRWVPPHKRGGISQAEFNAIRRIVAGKDWELRVECEIDDTVTYRVEEFDGCEVFETQSIRELQRWAHDQ